MPLSDYDKQFKKVVEVAKSVAGLTKMIEDQKAKATDALKKYEKSKDDKDQKIFSKACEAVAKATGALTKEVVVLSKEGSKLAKIIQTILKE
jgi:hypothetical protein